jgi:acetyl-CoA carboxylase carboxyl transferase subunit alpha
MSDVVKPKVMLPFEKPLRELEDQMQSLQASAISSSLDLSQEIRQIEAKIEQTKVQIYANLSAWDRVLLARHPQRPYSLDYIPLLFQDFQEFHGDRLFRDDAAIVGGTAFFEGQPVMVLGQQKGRNTKENILRNFGYLNPEGYRKALRLMKMANKFRLPIISIVDTPGAFPGVGAEERHVAEAIAVNLREMAQFEVPIIAVVIGEGGSGGALGVAVADRILILENAYYSVITPEGCAAILWKDRAHAAKAAQALKISAPELLKLGIVDEVLKEPLGGAHHNLQFTTQSIRMGIQKHLSEVQQWSPSQRVEERYQKYRKIGLFEESLVPMNENPAPTMPEALKSAF